MALSPDDIRDLTAWRQALHRVPELSGAEVRTATSVVRMLEDLGADAIHAGIGGHGVIGVFESGTDGPRVMLRCELDALPIVEDSDAAHASTVPGTAHLCGHDGHMAILAGVARTLARVRPERGAVLLMFQPAEEIGAGARAVVADRSFAGLRPDFVFALHNMPGMPLGRVAVREGPASCASRGMRIGLHGRTSHAAEPEKAVSPMLALSRLMPGLSALAEGRPGQADYALVTVTHARLGEAAFGITPGEAELFITLRTLTDARMAQLVQDAEALVARLAAEDGLGVSVNYHDVFDATVNAPKAVRIVRRALDRLGLSHGEEPLPMRASEDVGCFGAVAPLAFLLLGAGEETPPLHAPTYDFPDPLIATGAAVFNAILAEILGPAADDT
ncbi:amidohydrolase [Tropicibacter sp. S64]|uniref:amidohydrolase n=1 Tax=Tropicibacter sp. S64 TaxID=3415122 RepID=UPI003C7A903C